MDSADDKISRRKRPIMSDMLKAQSPAQESRWEQVQKEIAATGSYQLTETELIYGAKLAWRNSVRCIGRIQWSKLQVTDKIEQKLKKIQDDLKSQADKITALEQKIEHIEIRSDKINSILEQKIDDMHQNLKISHVCIYGVNETADENIQETIMQIINTNTNLNLREKDIMGCYRVGKRTENANKYRPTILKLANSELKSKLFKNVNKFKGKKIYFAEDLTKHRRILLKEAQTILGVRNVWSYKGYLYTKYEGHNARITCEADITKYTSRN
ncbi:unnamed protein product [Phaedon cochleariae]|uniref:nitric-oxide synthase (NADPH) n=1 Tax=Phaedon cochleariae TaxID=80249 RepID=A0A9N9X425_PHACE|nr:unnamed protein product [Phaedon cochleariae]